MLAKSFTIALAAGLSSLSLVNASPALQFCVAGTASGGFNKILGNQFNFTISGVSDPNNVLCGSLNSHLTSEALKFNPTINIGGGVRCVTSADLDPFKTVNMVVILDKQSPSSQLQALSNAVSDTFSDSEFGGSVSIGSSCDLSQTTA